MNDIEGMKAKAAAIIPLLEDLRDDLPFSRLGDDNLEQFNAMIATLEMYASDYAYEEDET